MVPIRRPPHLIRLLWALLAIAAGPAPAVAETEAGAEAVADVVVVGAGPAGMAAALEAKRAGAEKVLLVERRGANRTRQHVLGLLPGGIDALRRLGVDPRELRARRVAYHRIDGESLPVKEKGKAQGGRASSRIDAGVERVTPALFLETRHLESAMQALVRRTPGIEIRYHSPVLGAELARRSGRTARGPPGSEPVVLRTGSESGAEKTVRGRFLVVADGAHSPTRELLGVKVRTAGPTTRLMVGVLEQRGDGGFEGVYGRRGGKEARSVYRLGGLQTGVIVEPPPDLELVSQAERNRYFKEQARKVGARGELVLEPSLTPIELRRAEVDPAALHHQVFVIGEAARSTHAHSVAGVSWALKDAIRLGESLQRMLAPDSSAASRRTYRRFVRATDRATRRLHARLRPYFQSEPRRLVERDRAARDRSKGRGWRRRLARPGREAKRPAAKPRPFRAGREGRARRPVRARGRGRAKAR